MTQTLLAPFAIKQQLLSKLWVFAALNYLYCDVIGLMDSKMLKQYASGRVDRFTIDENFLLYATILMQIPMAMVFLSTVLPSTSSRIANVTAGTLMTGVQAATLFTGEQTKYYVFSSAVEMGTTAFISACALFAMKPSRMVPTAHADAGATV